MQDRMSKAFQVYHWRDNNVRDLKKEIQDLIINGNGDILRIPALLMKFSEKVRAKESKGGFWDQVDEFEKELILDALEKFGGDKKKAAEYLGLSRSSLYDLIKRLEIKHPS